MRAAIGAGYEVTVRGGHLLLKPLTPIPALRRGLRLYPDDPEDPQVFRVDLSAAGKPPTRVVFSRDPEAEGAAMRLLMLGMCLRQRPAVRNPRPWANGGLVAGAATLAIRRRLHRRASA
ncbi:MAG TPA: hypothetical protein VFN05_10210 [Actinomycetes bacterium]|nr:hypothetical protein [Actinomycetes bacterium]